MPILAIFAPVLQWVFSTVVIKFVVLASVVAVMLFLVPVIVGYAASFIDTSALTTAFSYFPPAVWFFFDLFQIGFALPLIISAYVTRFLIRRLPFVG